MIANLVSKLARRATRRRVMTLADLHVTVYTRADCCCCHKAIDVLESARLQYGFVIGCIDVDLDPELRARHGSSVPVVEVDGKVRFRGEVNPALLERLLARLLAAASAAGRASSV